MQPSHTLIDPAHAHHAVLSHRPLQHLDDLPKLNPAPFDQAHHHAQILQNRPRPGRAGSALGCAAPTGVLRRRRVELACFLTLPSGCR